MIPMISLFVEVLRLVVFVMKYLSLLGLPLSGGKRELVALL